MKRIIFTLWFAFFLCNAAALSRTRKIITWQNLASFQKDDWFSDFWEDYRAIASPSELDQSLSPLDNDVTGGGIWTGRSHGYSFGPNKKNIFSFPQILEANLTLKYYHSGPNNGITFSPCLNPDMGNLCILDENSRMEWRTATFRINLTSTKENVTLEIGTRGSSGRNYILDEVTLSYDVAEEPCNESFEFRGIDCHNYYSCVDYSDIRYFKCEKEDGLAFNPEVGMCGRMENVEGCATPKGEYRPDPDNCSNYYFCPNVLKEEECELRTCPDDLLFSVDSRNNIQECTIPSKAKCA